MSSRSLGQLTIDVVARTAGFTQGMDKASRESDKWRRQVKKDVEAAGRAVGVASGVIVGALTAIIVDSAKTATEINKLSQVAGSTGQEFQRYAVGAEAVGIQQEKLADIFKDVSDKVGDFLQTGGGPLADFFENIAPAIGVTADQFRNLSGPQALGLYVDSLEKANLSQSEMVFFMEAIASDSTALLPLLKNNAAGLNELADAAQAAGAIMSDDVLASTDELNAAMFLMEQNMAGAKNQIAQEFIPVLSDLAGELVTVEGQGSAVSEMASDLASGVKQAAAVAVGASTAFQLWGKALGGQVAVVQAFITDGVDAAREALRAVQEDLDATAQAGATRINRLLSAGEEGGGNAAVKKLAATMMEAREQTTATGQAMKATAEELKRIEVFAERAKLPESIKEQIELQEAYNALVRDLRTDEEVLSDQLRDRLGILTAIKGISDDEQAQVASRIANDAFQMAPEFAGLAPEVGGALGELNNIADARADLEDWYSEQLAMLETYRKDHSELNAQWDEQEAQLRKQHADRLLQIDQAREIASLTAAETLFANMSDLTRQFAGEQSAAFKVMFAVEKAAAIARSIVAIQTGIAQAAANPWPANLPAMASVAAATAGIVSNIQAVSLAGMAHDGIDSVPMSGTWLLEKGERVTTAQTSAKLDKTLDQVQQGSGSQIRIVNAFDDDHIKEYLGSTEGERIIINSVKRNQRLIKTLAGL